MILFSLDPALYLLDRLFEPSLSTNLHFGAAAFSHAKLIPLSLTVEGVALTAKEIQESSKREETLSSL